MLDLDAISASKKSADAVGEIPSKISGVYFLFSTDGQLLYIGQSKYLRSRIRSHIKSGHIQFTHFSFVEVNCPVFLEQTERQYIMAFAPTHNIRHHPDKWPAIQERMRQEAIARYAANPRPKKKTKRELYIEWLDKCVADGRAVLLELGIIAA